MFCFVPKVEQSEKEGEIFLKFPLTGMESTLILYISGPFKRS